MGDSEGYWGYLVWDYRTGDIIDVRTGEVVGRIYVPPIVRSDYDVHCMAKSVRLKPTKYTSIRRYALAKAVEFLVKELNLPKNQVVEVASEIAPRIRCRVDDSRPSVIALASIIYEEIVGIPIPRHIIKRFVDPATVTGYIMRYRWFIKPPESPFRSRAMKYLELIAEELRKKIYGLDDFTLDKTLKIAREIIKRAPERGTPLSIAAATIYVVLRNVIGIDVDISVMTRITKISDSAIKRLVPLVEGILGRVLSTMR